MNMETNNQWSLAALDGLLLSLVTIIFSLITSVFVPKGIVSILLWALKFGGCLYLLFYFMKKYSGNFDHVSYKQSFFFGFLVCLFSSVICACFMFLSITVLFPETVDQITEQVQGVLATQNYDAEQESQAMAMLNNLPQIMLFGSLIYYTLYGLIVSAILANFTKKENPFPECE